MEPMKHHQHKSRGQTYDWNCIFEEYEWKRKKVPGACYLPQNRNLMIHVPKQHIVFWCTAEGERLYHEKSTKSKSQNEKRATWERLSDKKSSRLSCSRVSRGHGRQPKQWQFKDFLCNWKQEFQSFLKAFVLAKTKPGSLKRFSAPAMRGAYHGFPKAWCTVIVPVLPVWDWRF